MASAAIHGADEEWEKVEVVVGEMPKEDNDEGGVGVRADVREEDNGGGEARVEVDAGEKQASLQAIEAAGRRIRGRRIKVRVPKLPLLDLAE